MAEVVHRYVRDPAAAAEKEQRRAEEAKIREAEAKRKELVRQSERRSANRGSAGLRKERTALERTRRLKLEMELAERRGQLVERAVVLQQASFLLVAMQSRALSAPSAWCRRLLNVSDPRAMTDLLRQMMVSVLEEISTLPEKLTADPDGVDGGNGAALH